MQKNSNYKKPEWPYNLIADLEIQDGPKLAPIDPLPEDFLGSLEYLLHVLPDQRSVEILRLRYQERMTYGEIGAVVNLSQTRVAQLLEHVRREIVKPCWEKYLRYGVQGIIEQRMQQQKEIYQQRVALEVRKAVEVDQQEREKAAEADRLKNLPIEERILITELNLDVRAQNSLRRRGYETVGDLLRLDYKAFTRIRYVGEMTRKKILAEIERLGFDCDHLKGKSEALVIGKVDAASGSE